MADETQTGFTPLPSVPAHESAAAATGGSASPVDADGAADHDPFAERPEVYVGAAFAGGLVLAGLLRLLGR
ncbi:MAG: hypothetical protein M3481_00885 [Actinomycetota bacterium]|jgi:hypothetical protein|nr:hypothetical protein [Actinomycetota bacterium]